MKSYVIIYDQESNECGVFADEVYVSNRRRFSGLLGPDGHPLLYEQPDPVGFKLQPSGKSGQGET